MNAFFKIKLNNFFSVTYSQFLLFSKGFKQLCLQYCLVFFFNINLFEIFTSVKSFFFLFLIIKHISLLRLNLLLDIVVIDFFSKKLRFKLNYILLSIKYQIRFIISFFITELTPLLSVTGLFSNANWYEREIWDLFGILFLQHPDLRRILTDYGFLQFPLRKDFPLSGFQEIFYNDTVKQLKFEKLNLMQEYRFFNLTNLWLKA